MYDSRPRRAGPPYGATGQKDEAELTASKSTSESAQWPTALGYRMPAEWEPHEATWLSWPHNRDSWPGVFAGVEPAMSAFVRALAECEPVYINVLDAAHERHVRDLLAKAAPPERLRFHRFPTNDAWCRDHGAVFVTRSGAQPRLAVDFDYNAWGGKYPPFDRDRLVGRQMAEALQVPRFARPDIVLEGGSIEVNGAGALLTTEQCLLNPNRNPALRRADIERVLRDSFGVNEILWLGDGIEGDDTDGHIDDLTRFVAPGRVVTVIEPNTADKNHEPLEANRRLLDALAVAGRPARRGRAADAGAAVPRRSALAGELCELLCRERRRARARVRLQAGRGRVLDHRAIASRAGASCRSTAACSSRVSARCTASRSRCRAPAAARMPAGRLVADDAVAARAGGRAIVARGTIS